MQVAELGMVRGLVRIQPDGLAQLEERVLVVIEERRGHTAEVPRLGILRLLRGGLARGVVRLGGIALRQILQGDLHPVPTPVRRGRDAGRCLFLSRELPVVVRTLRRVRQERLRSRDVAHHLLGELPGLELGIAGLRLPEAALLADRAADGVHVDRRADLEDFVVVREGHCWLLVLLLVLLPGVTGRKEPRLCRPRSAPVRR